MKKPMFLLLHGGWHGSWCWKYVIPLLEAAGYVALAPDLPGHGIEPCSYEQITPRSYAETVKALMAARPDEQFILLGHSVSGMLISQIAELWPEQIQELVYLAALLPQSGIPYTQIMEQDQETLTWSSVSFSKYYATVHKEKITDFFYADCSAADITFARERLVPEPLVGIVASLTLSSRFAQVPRTYIRCLHDRAIGPATQAAMIRAQPCRFVFELESSHSPFFSKPESLAEILLALASKPPHKGEPILTPLLR